jgi:WD40 repeat protein
MARFFKSKRLYKGSSEMGKMIIFHSYSRYKTVLLACFILSVFNVLSLIGCSLAASQDTRPEVSIVSELSQADSKSILAVHPDGVSVAPEGETGESSKEIPLSFFYTYKPHDGEINSLAVSLDGRGVYSGGADGRVVYTNINATNGKLESKTLISGTLPILALSLSPDERFLAISRFSSVGILDLVSTSIVQHTDRIDGRVTALDWDPRGEVIALGRSDGDLFIWNLDIKEQQNSPLRTLEKYDGVVSSVVRIFFHPLGRIFFVADRSGGITIWRLLRTEREMGIRDNQADFDSQRTGMRRLTLDSIQGRLEDVWLNHDGSELFAINNEGVLFRYKIRGGGAFRKSIIRGR